MSFLNFDQFMAFFITIARVPLIESTDSHNGDGDDDNFVEEGWHLILEARGLVKSFDHKGRRFLHPVDNIFVCENGSLCVCDSICR